MRNLFLNTALLPVGWADNVLLTIDAHGIITEVAAGASCPADAERLAGATLPGIANLHSHAHQRAIAGLAERSGRGGDSFWTWREAMFAAVARFDPDGFEAVATQLYVEMLKAGYTRVAEFHYLHHDRSGSRYADPAEMSERVIAAARTAGIGLTLLPVCYNSSGFGAAATPQQRRFVHDADGFNRLLETLRARHRFDAHLVIGIAPHSLRAVPPDVLGEIVAAAPAGPIHIHVAEQRREVEECLAHTGRRPVEWLLERCEVGPRWCLVHATHVSPQEVSALARSGAVVGLCPTTEANLGDGVFPAEAFAAAGGRFGIGSDSQVSVSPVEELRWLEYGQRLASGRRTVLAGGPDRSTGRALLAAATQGGSAACGARPGGIAVGTCADLVTLDTAHPRLIGRIGDNVLDCWIFSGNTPMVRTVAVAGTLVVRDGHHAQEDRAAAAFAAALRALAD